VRIAEDFSPFGHFYKTQVPVLWTSDNGDVVRVSSPEVIRETAVAMDEVVNRPMLLLSAAVDFEQYSAQYGIVADIFAGPMCGRAYFKEAFLDPETKDWDSLEASFSRIALPRIAQIKGLATVISQPWWHKFDWMADEAKSIVNLDAKPKDTGVKADYGY
jgi:tagatose-1,6-bisphosphate aldolase